MVQACNLGMSLCDKFFVSYSVVFKNVVLVSMFSVQQNILGGEKCFSYLLCEAIQNGFVSFEINVFPGKIAKHSYLGR